MKSTTTERLLALSRIALGFIFFWAFIDKLFGLGFSTASDKGWLDGGSPTLGYLKNATFGPLANIFHAMAGSGFVDGLFMAGLGLIGLALITGVGMRVATWSGSLMLLLMYLSAMPPKNNPLLDDHIIYILFLQCLRLHNAGDVWGLGEKWGKTKLVKKYAWMK